MDRVLGATVIVRDFSVIPVKEFPCRIEFDALMEINPSLKVLFDNMKRLKVEIPDLDTSFEHSCLAQVELSNFRKVEEFKLSLKHYNFRIYP